MTFQGYLRILRDQWRVVVSVIIIFVLASFAISILRPPEYTARLTLFVSAQPSSSENSAYQAGQLAQQRVESYRVLLSSGRVSSEVIDRLNLDASPDEISERITATNPPDSVIIELAVTGPSPEVAAAVANAVGAVMNDLITELAKPNPANAIASVAIQMIEPAPLPRAPSSPGTAPTVVLGLLIGIAFGAGAALARNALDTSIKSGERLRETVDAPMLGTIAFDRQARQRPLTVQRDRRSPQAETFRQLRTKLQFLNLDSSSKVYTITSALPREGKTTTLCNLAIALGSAGKRTLIIEADLREPSLAELLGLHESTGLTTIATGQASMEQAIQHWPPGCIDVLTSGLVPPNPSELLAATNLADLLAPLREQYDVILIDTPPLLAASEAATVAPGTDGAILVCRFKKTHQAHVRAAVETLDAVSTRVLGTVLTHTPNAERLVYPRSQDTRRDTLRRRFGHLANLSRQVRSVVGKSPTSR